MADIPEIFIKIDGKEYGPLSASDIKRLIEDGSFKRDDLISIGGRGVWVKADNVERLNALFEEREKRRSSGAFNEWLAQIKSGKSALALSKDGAAAERERIAAELDELEKERKKLENEEQAMRAVDRLREAEITRLDKERARINSEKEQLERASYELADMTKSLRRRRFLPFLVSIVVILAVLSFGIPGYYYGIYKPGKEKEKLTEEFEQKQKLYDQMIADLEAKQEHMSSLELELTEAKTESDKEREASIQREIAETQLEIDLMLIKICEETGREIPANLAPDPQIDGLLEEKGRSGRSVVESDKVIRTIFPEVGEVYLKAIKKRPSLAGQIVIDITITAEGETEDIEIVVSSITEYAPEVDRAIIEQVEGLDFGPAPADFRGTYVFYLEPR